MSDAIGVGDVVRLKGGGPVWSVVDTVPGGKLKAVSFTEDLRCLEIEAMPAAFVRVNAKADKADDASVVDMGWHKETTGLLMRSVKQVWFDSNGKLVATDDGVAPDSIR